MNPTNAAARGASAQLTAKEVAIQSTADQVLASNHPAILKRSNRHEERSEVRTALHHCLRARVVSAAPKQGGSAYPPCALSTGRDRKFKPLPITSPTSYARSTWISASTATLVSSLGPLLLLSSGTRRLDAGRDQSPDVPNVRAAASADDPQSREPLCHFSAKRAELLRVTIIKLGGLVQFGMAAARGIWPDHTDPVEPARWKLFAEMLGMGAVDPVVANIAAGRGFDLAELWPIER